MADIQKVIEAWKIFRNSNPYQICDGREFRAIAEPEYCMGQMIADTIELLKEQQPVEMDLCNGEPFCPTCGSIVRCYYNFCVECGQKFKKDSEGYPIFVGDNEKQTDT